MPNAETQNAIDRRNIKIARPKSHPDRHRQPRGDDLHRAGAISRIERHRIDLARFPANRHTKRRHHPAPSAAHSAPAPAVLW